jgi:tetratricopeptide (TPR) repeat protein
MNDLDRLLERERELERRLAAGVHQDLEVDGWTAALMFFHLAQWRGRLLAALADHAEGRSHSAPPGNIDEFNDAELPAGRNVTLEQAAARSDSALASLIERWRALGDRPFAWYVAETTSEALTRNSYLHPRVHIASYLIGRGEEKEGHMLAEETALELRLAAAHPRILGAALYNLANVRVTEGRNDEAITLLEEALPMRPDLGSYAIEDSAFEALRNSPRFRRLGNTTGKGQPR